MLTLVKRIGVGLLLVTALAGCSISRQVTAAPAGTKIGKIYVERNKYVLMGGLNAEIVSQLQGLGFDVGTYDEGAPRPADGEYWIVYTANWRWDMAMYLTYFQATLLDNGRVLGRVSYDATWGGGRPDKFGRTGEKIRPLLIDLMGNVERAHPAATSLGSR
jgi:hypothetical protein